MSPPTEIRHVGKMSSRPTSVAETRTETVPPSPPSKKGGNRLVGAIGVAKRGAGESAGAGTGASGPAVGPAGGPSAGASARVPTAAATSRGASAGGTSFAPLPPLPVFRACELPEGAYVEGPGGARASTVSCMTAPGVRPPGGTAAAAPPSLEPRASRASLSLSLERSSWVTSRVSEAGGAQYGHVCTALVMCSSFFHYFHCALI